MTLLPFYRVDFPVGKLPQQFTFTEYASGHEVVSHTIKEKDLSFMKLSEMLTSEKSGWRYDLNTYAPKLLFSSSVMKINCTGRAIVVNYDSGGGEWVQISKDGYKTPCPRSAS